MKPLIIPWIQSSSLLFCSLFVSLPVVAQVTADGTTSTTVTNDGNNFTINDGDKADGNLFHSFRDFSVPTNGSAFFNNAPDVINIINRVTGGNISSIDGLIRANGSANLFLINPAGIIFGPNASLNIGGSFLGSTADSLLFPEGEFSATDLDNPPLLTINAPIGLGIRDEPAPITNQSVVNNSNGLEVSVGENITLIGGDIDLARGNILAPGGVVNLGGLSVAGEVRINSDGSLTFPEDVSRADVSLTNGTSINVISNNEGSVTVNARNLEILGGSSIFAGITLGNQQADAQAGDIVIDTTDQVTIAGEANSGSGIANIVGDLFGANFTSSQPTQGNAGNISIDTDKLEGTGAFVIASVANGEGNAGQVTINARQSVLLDGGLFAGITSLVGPSALGNGADITITTPSLSISNNVGIITSTTGQGNAGNIFINATDSISLDNSSQLQAVTFSTGDAGKIVIDAENADIALNNQSIASTLVFPGASGQGGDINITAGSLSLASGAQLNSSTSGMGNAGTITINAADSISFDNGLALSTVESTGVGNAAGINLTTSNLSLTNGGQLLASTRGQGDAGNVTVNANNIFLDGQNNQGFPSGIFSQVGDPNQSVIPVGNAGGIELNTNSLSVNNEAQLSASTFGEGNAGTITINATETVAFDGGDAFSTVEATGVGTAGGIEITTSNLSLTNGGQLLASTPVGTGGNITLQIADSLILREESTISAQAFGNANGGNVTIDAELIIAALNQNNDIIASAQQGIGGNINITAEGVFGLEERSSTPPNETNDIDVSSEFGLDGTVSISTPDVGIKEAIEAAEIIEPQTLGANACSRGGAIAGTSSFTIAGKGGVPPELTEPLSSDTIYIEGKPVASEAEKEEEKRKFVTQIEREEPFRLADVVPARGMIIKENGDVILTAYPTPNTTGRIPTNKVSCHS